MIHPFAENVNTFFKNNLSFFAVPSIPTGIVGNAYLVPIIVLVGNNHDY
jgi:hypothetical protein